jgi:hypothetical protein
VIRLSGALVVVAIGFLVGGLATSSLLLVYVAIVVSVVALLLLAVGVVLKRDELFGDEGQSPAGGERAFGQSALAGQDASVAQGNFGGSSDMARWSSPPAPAARTHTDLAETRIDLAETKSDFIETRAGLAETRTDLTPGRSASPDDWLERTADEPADVGLGSLVDPESPAGPWSPADAEGADAADSDTGDASVGGVSTDDASGDDPHAAAPTAVLPVAGLGTEAEAPEGSAAPEAEVEADVAETEGDVAAEAEDSSSSAGKDGDYGQREVVVVPGVPRYHDANCILIRFMGDDDLQKMSLNEAAEAGCTPCRACVPEHA